ncbi:hypothetical protein EON65_22860 [archaeon]|nr:MAG: hypothetical protein EON65_22860 [archaeon]
MATLPIIPFAKLPRIDYNKKFEKKKRLIWTEDNDFVTPDPKEIEESSESSSSGSSSEYDLLDHIATLMPGYNEEGKLTKKAHDAHLEDMRPKKVRKDYFKYVRASWQYVSTMRARERERRKHYIIREYEEKVRKFDEMRRKVIQDELDAQEKEIKLEAYRREQRIARNSRKVSNIVYFQFTISCLCDSAQLLLKI